MNNKPPAGQTKGKKEAVEAMFDAIAPRYDLLNRVLSVGIDRRWRKKAVESLRSGQPRRILDVATGTGDLAIEALRLDPEKVIGVDISENMIALGRKKIEKRKVADRVVLQKGDSEKLPFSDNQFDAAMVAFGVRNFENLQKGLSEIHRVLKPGGDLVVLEFSRPRRFPIKQAFNLYFTHVLPKIGRAVSRDKGAYSYLPESVKAFPDGPSFLAEMADCGYVDLQWEPLTFGIASIYTGKAE